MMPSRTRMHFDSSPTTKSEPDEKSPEFAPDLYSLFLRHILKLTSNDPLKADEISKCLDLEKSQVNAWLKRGVADGQIKKINKPVRYQSSEVEQRQASLLGL